MVAPVLALGLLGLAAAPKPWVPKTSTSKGFHLVVNVMDPSKDFDPPLQSTYVASIHVGAGLALVGNIKSTKNARIFYQNGTAAEHRAGKTTVITDRRHSVVPLGHQAGARQELGRGVDCPPGRRPRHHRHRARAPPRALRHALTPRCGLPATRASPTTRTSSSSSSRATSRSASTAASIAPCPRTALPSALLAECTKLNELPAGSYSSHQFAIEDRCYDEVDDIDWDEEDDD